MNLNCSRLKSLARQSMGSASPRAIPMTLLYLLLTTGIGTLVELFFANPIIRFAEFSTQGLDFSRSLSLTLSQVGGVGLFFHILILLASVAFSFGYNLWCLGTTRGGIGEWRDLFSGCNMLGRVLLLRLATLTLIVLWYAVLTMAAMLLSIVVLFVLPFGILAVLPIFVAAIGVFVWQILHYSLADLCLMDNPDKGVFQAISESRRLMRGHCGQLILLNLSFLGWFLLELFIQLVAQGLLFLIVGAPLLFNGDPMSSMAVVTATSPLVVEISSLLCWPYIAWLTPYRTMTLCHFYDTLRSTQP